MHLKTVVYHPIRNRLALMLGWLTFQPAVILASCAVELPDYPNSYSVANSAVPSGNCNLPFSMRPLHRWSMQVSVAAGKRRTSPECIRIGYFEPPLPQLVFQKRTIGIFVETLKWVLKIFSIFEVSTEILFSIHRISVFPFCIMATSIIYPMMHFFMNSSNIVRLIFLSFYCY